METIIAYGRLVKKYEILPQTRMRKLIRQAQKGSRRALDLVVLHNLKLVLKVVSEYNAAGPATELLDIIQQGNIGLMIAIRKFNLECNFKFSTFAYFCIRSQISRYFEDNLTVVRLPSYLHVAKREIRKKHEKGQDLTERDKRHEIRAQISAFSLNALSMAGDGETEYMDMFARVEPKSSYPCDLKALLNGLDDRQRDIVRGRLEGETLKILGAKHNITRERVRQLYAESLQKIYKRYKRDIGLWRE